ncbi:hypothetical protein RSAG8_06241, partial [Rhizoctonia solani AG-8 WAC10335]
MCFARRIPPRPSLRCLTISLFLNRRNLMNGIGAPSFRRKASLTRGAPLTAAITLLSLQLYSLHEHKAVSEVDECVGAKSKRLHHARLRRLAVVVSAMKGNSPCPSSIITICEPSTAS